MDQRGTEHISQCTERMERKTEQMRKFRRSKKQEWKKEAVF